MKPSTTPRAPEALMLGFMEVTSMHEFMLQLQDVVDALGENIAVLDPQGAIVLVNEGWIRFACDNGNPELVHSGVGSNYLEVCQAAAASGSPYAQGAHDGLRAVLAGERETFALIYPCDAPEHPRWFVMRVRRLLGTTPGAAVSHVDITDWYGRVQQVEAGSPS